MRHRIIIFVLTIFNYLYNYIAMLCWYDPLFVIGSMIATLTKKKDFLTLTLTLNVKEMKEDFNKINSGEVNPLEQFIIERTVCIMEISDKLKSGLLVVLVLIGIAYYGTIAHKINNFLFYVEQKIKLSAVTQKIKKLFSVFILTEEEYRTFYTNLH